MKKKRSNEESPQYMQITERMNLYCQTPTERMRCETFFRKEPETIAWIDSFRGGSFVDIGANIGVYSLYAATTHPDMQVYSVEPLFFNYNRLGANCRLNGLHNVKYSLMAIGSANRFITLRYDQDEYGITINPDGKCEEYVNGITLDSYVSLCALGYVNHIKIDVDGAEWEILRGASKTLQSRDLKSVLIEHNYERKRTQLIDLFRSYGFTADNEFNRLENHSRHRRENEDGNTAENIVFVRKLNK